mgnify:CR=1 FL=1
MTNPELLDFVEAVPGEHTVIRPSSAALLTGIPQAENARLTAPNLKGENVVLLGFREESYYCGRAALYLSRRAPANDLDTINQQISDAEGAINAAAGYGYNLVFAGALIDDRYLGFRGDSPYKLLDFVQGMGSQSPNYVQTSSDLYEPTTKNSVVGILRKTPYEFRALIDLETLERSS